MLNESISTWTMCTQCRFIHWNLGYRMEWSEKMNGNNILKKTIAQWPSKNRKKKMNESKENGRFFLSNALSWFLMYWNKIHSNMEYNGVENLGRKNIWQSKEYHVRQKLVKIHCRISFRWDCSVCCCCCCYCFFLFICLWVQAKTSARMNSNKQCK